MAFPQFVYTYMVYNRLVMDVTMKLFNIAKLAAYTFRISALPVVHALTLKTI